MDTESGKAKRTGSLALFFRKFYTLATVRLEHFCYYLEIDDEVKRKIWNNFEHVMRSHIDLMKDRHVDQILMCSVYIACKVNWQACFY